MACPEPLRVSPLTRLAPTALRSLCFSDQDHWAVSGQRPHRHLSRPLLRDIDLIALPFKPSRVGSSRRTDGRCSPPAGARLALLEGGLSRRRTPSIPPGPRRTSRSRRRDEPNSGLDHAESEHLAIAIDTVRTESACAVLLVEHDVDFVMNNGNRVVVLNLGPLLMQGSPRKYGRTLPSARPISAPR
jgi:hypothetical protein